MNLCLLCREIGPAPKGGLPRAMCDLAVALHEEGHDVSLLTDSPGMRAGELPGVSVRVVGHDPPARWAGAETETVAHSLTHAAGAWREVRRVHEQERPVDAVLAPLWRSEGAVCVLDRDFPTVVSCMTTLRTLSEIDPAYGGLEDLHGRLGLERAALSRSGYLHGLTGAALEKTIEDYGLRPRAQTVIGRGLRDRGRQPLVPPDPAGPQQVLFVGRIAHRKGADVLLAAAKILIEPGRDVSFTLVGAPGDGLLQESFARACEAQPELGRAVRFTGQITDHELDRLYAEADVICVPSRYESHGVVLVEAMMHGRPIVSCPSGGIREVVESGVNGLLTAPGDPVALADALARVLDDPRLRAKLAGGARQAYEERFQARAIARRMVAFIEEVIAIHDSVSADGVAMSEELGGLLFDAGAATSESAPKLAGELLGERGSLCAAQVREPLRAPVELSPQASATLDAMRGAALERMPRGPQDAATSGPRVSAVVLTRNREDYLPRALDSLAEQGIGVDLLVIDNASGPACAAAVRRECDSRSGVRLHRNEENLGAARGRMLGAELAHCELVMFLDDDAEMMPGALAHMVDALDSDPRAGAVTATVVSPDGVVEQSGGSITLTEEFACFELIGQGERFDSAALEPSGRADWLGGGAALMRRSLLTEYGFDPGMGAYYEDNEWCYRISRERPDCFRRSREALVLHHLAGSSPAGVREPDRLRLVELLAACARFYELHGLLLGPYSWTLLPDRVAADGDLGLGDVRLLMELITAKGIEWTLGAWNAGELENLLQANKRREQIERTHPELEVLRPEVPRLNDLVYEQQQTLSWLFEREATLRTIEAGGWWHLRGRLQAPLRAIERLRALLRRPG